MDFGRNRCRIVMNIHYADMKIIAIENVAEILVSTNVHPLQWMYIDYIAQHPCDF